MQRASSSDSETGGVESARLPTIVFVAGFGDGAGMFEPLAQTALTSRYRLIAIDLPGFAGAPPLEGPTTLEGLADVVQDVAAAENARILVAHSVASIIASLAARRTPSKVDTIISLEGNLTAEDAYFSGTAADYENASEFRRAFLARLDEMAKHNPVVGRYRSVVAKADPQALWELGCDTRRFSLENIPGDVLTETGDVCYLYNPENCHEASLEWLRRSSIRRMRMDGATHWTSVDQPHRLAGKILEALDGQ